MRTLAPSTIEVPGRGSWAVTVPDGLSEGTPTLWARDPRFSDTAGWSNRLSWDGGIIYVQGPEQSSGRYLRVVPGWVSRMKAAVDSVGR